MEKQYLSFPLETKGEIKEDDQFFYFEGYLSVFGNVDYGDDVVVKGAFAEAVKDYKGDTPVLWQHNRNEPIGVFSEMKEDDKGLFVVGRLPKDDDFVKGRVVPQLRVKSVKSMSIGFIATDAEHDKGLRYLKAVDLMEGSLVTFPMNDKADITSIKAVVPYQDLQLADRNRPWDSGQAITRLKAQLDSEDEPSVDYRKGFLWYDSENADNFTAYKLPIADIYEGRLYAVPRAIFAAAGAMRGARGGVDIQDADRAGVIANIERYYRKMGLESPFQDRKSFRLDDLSGVNDIQTLEKMLKKGIYCNGSTSKQLAKMILDAIERDDDSGVERYDDTKEFDALLADVKNLTEKI